MTVEARDRTVEVRSSRVGLLLLAVILACASCACATVPQYRRGHLADRTMPGNESKLKKQTARKFHVTREAAAGGDGEPAGGGCGCGN